MKTICTLALVILYSTLQQAQFKSALDMNLSLKKNILASPQISMNGINRFSDLVYNPNRTSSLYNYDNSSPDSTKYNMYGDLLDDNPLYNEKSSLLMVVFRVTMANLSTFLIPKLLQAIYRIRVFLLLSPVAHS